MPPGISRSSRTAKSIHFFGMFLLAEALLRYYDAPLPFTNSSFHQLLPNAAADLAKNIDLASLNTMLQRIKAILDGTERPSVFNPFELVMFVGLLLNMAVAEGLAFATAIVGFVGIGIGSLLGPLFIPWLVVPKVSWLFWNWFSFMLQYSFYQVVASALVFVWTSVIGDSLKRPSMATTHSPTRCPCWCPSESSILGCSSACFGSRLR